MSIQVENHLFALETAHTGLYFGVNINKELQTIHWGGKLALQDCARLLKEYAWSGFDPNTEKETTELCPWGGFCFCEPSLKASCADGLRDLKMCYVSHRVSGDKLVVLMEDVRAALQAELIYQVREETDVIEKKVRFINRGELPVHLETALSGIWNIPWKRGQRLTHTVGKWGGEMQLKRCMLSEGKMVLESRKGFTSPNANPWFAIDAGNAQEESGEVWYGALAWSGNWKIVVEKTVFGNVRVLAGANDFDFSWYLEPGESFETPMFVGGYTASGFGDMSRKMHAYARSCVMPQVSAAKVRKVLYNSWEATAFDVNERNQMCLAEKAAELGVELFVMDDGWFGARNSDRAGLGDWKANPEKFPSGLETLIAHVNDLGMEFGLWVEPEMTNPDSDLYRAHPDWVYRFSGRPSSLARNQLILNLAKQEVRDYVLQQMRSLLERYRISFIKWDMNRAFSEPGWMEAPECHRKEIWVRHVRALYGILDELRTQFPHVEFEACAGGGGRTDLGILRYSEQIWTSDNTDAVDRLGIQNGFSQMYPPKAMMCWVTDCPNFMNGRTVSMKYRFLCAMMGSLGIGGNLNRWTSEELSCAKEMIRVYKQLREIVQHGSMYRLETWGMQATAVQYCYGEKSVAFVLGGCEDCGEGRICIPLRGLQFDSRYRVFVDGQLEGIWSASTLMQHGFMLQMNGDFDSKWITLEQTSDENDSIAR